VLGLASAEEVTEIEELRKQYAGIEQAIMQFSILLEEQAMANVITPSAELKAKIIAAVQSESGKSHVSPLISQSDPVPPSESSSAVVRSISKWKFTAAASVILLVCSAVLNFYLYQKFDNKDKAYQALLTERNTLQASNQVYQTNMKQWQSAAEMMMDPVMAKVELKGAKGSNEVVQVLWNTNNKDVFVMTAKMPAPSKGKQYQLWALIDGKPVDAGVLDPNCKSICKMKNMPQADAFAITLEKEGGSVEPDLQALYVMGKV